MPVCVPPRARRVTSLIVTGCASVMFLTACSLLPTSSSTPIATALNSLPAESSQSATMAVPTATPTQPVGIFSPIGLSCSTLLPDDFVFEVSPNFARSDEYVPAAGSSDAYIASNQGLACSIVSLSGGDSIYVAVASLDQAGLTDITAQLQQSQTETGEFGDGIRGFFANDSGMGVINAVTDKFWIVVSSPLFSQASDASVFVKQVLSALS